MCIASYPGFPHEETLGYDVHTFTFTPVTWCGVGEVCCLWVGVPQEVDHVFLIMYKMVTEDEPVFWCVCEQYIYY